MTSVDHETDEEEDYVAAETNDSVAKIFKNARDIEKLCQSLPDVPIDVDPDHEIEERLNRLKKRPVKKDARVALAELELNEHQVKYIDDNVKNKVKICVDVIDKKESDKKVNSFVNPESDQTEEDCEAKLEFNQWFEEKIKKNEEKPRAKLFEESCGHSFTHGRKKHVCEDDDKYKQQYTNTNSDHRKQNQFHSRDPDVLLYMLLVAMAKVLNNHLSNFSHSPIPMIILHPAAHTQFPMPMQATKPVMSRVVVKSGDTESECYCVKVTSAIADMTSMASSGVRMGTKWARLRIMNLKEKVRLTIIGLVIGEKLKIVHIEDTRNVKC